MAAPSAKPGPNGVGSAGGSTPSRNRDWGALRSDDPGSAFRGLTKGRGGGTDRGGRGGGRGGRAGRAGNSSLRGSRGGGDQGNGARQEAAPAKIDTPPAIKPSPTTVPPPPSTEKPTTPATSNEKNPRPKGPSRKASRNVPTLILPPSTPTIQTPLATAPPRQPNRRKRSQQHGKSPVTTASPKQGLPVDPNPRQNLLQPQRARTGPPSPVSLTKDTPPHLSVAHDIPTFDLKHNIDALVERVRAVAMENNRPTTPGSHIDWAGDDDDSLPDLDDWGVTTSTSITGDKANKIGMSPILANDLKPLPELSARVDDSREGGKTNTASDSVIKTADKAPPRNEIGKSQHIIPPKASPLNSKMDIAMESNNSAGKEFSTPQTTLHTVLVPDATAAQASAHSAHTTNVSEPASKTLLHPSLPAKPVAAVQSLAAHANPRHGGTPMRVSVPVKQPVAIEKPSEPLTATAEETPRSVEPPSIIVEKPLSSIIATKPPSQPVAAAPTDEMSPEHGSSTEDLSAKPGLAASIHAPVSVPESVASLPNLVSSLTTAPRAFNPTHQRAHTVGRTQAFNYLHTAPAFERFSRSGASSPRGGYGAHVHHGRTHSSPPAGSGSNPRVHSQRPIITGDAISRIARTIGGIQPPRPKEISIAKEDC